MKITILVTGLPPQHVGGTETQTIGLAKQLSRRHDVTILTRREKGADAVSSDGSLTVRRFRYVNLPVIRFITHFISAFNWVRKLRKETDILLCMMLSPNGLVGAVSGKTFGLKTIASVRGGDWYMPGPIGRMINSFVVGNTDAVHVQTERIRSDVKKRYPQARVATIPNGVDTSEKAASGESVVFLGNLSARKGVDYLIRAMKEVDGRLLIFGDGEERKNLESLAAGLRLGEKIRFMGRTDPSSVRENLRKGCVFVLPSVIGEGMPNVILEAMSVGLPVVSTRISGIPDIVVDGRTGLLVEPGDPAALADAINRLLEDRNLRKSMTINTLKKVKEYSWDSVTGRFERLFSSVAGD